MVEKTKGKSNYKKAAEIFESFIAMKPEMAEEMGFLEIRQLGLKVKTVLSLDRPDDDEIQEVYNLEFLGQIKIWLNVVSNQSGSNPLRNAVISLLINTLKVSSHLKYHPFHLKVFELLSQLSQLQ